LDNQYRKKLEEGITKISLSSDNFYLKNLQDEKSKNLIDQLLAYHQLLIKWNKAYNLTAVRDPEQMISRHLLDSLSIAPYLNGKVFIDVGTGAGLPGIVLAIIYPEYQFDLLDSNGKKTRFLFQVKTELNLQNIAIHHCRVEHYNPVHGYDGVLSRAFATLEDMVTSSRALLKPDGCFYAMKGIYPEDEVEALKKLSVSGKNYKVVACHKLQVPDEDGQRHLLMINNG
jgi:16S rRNA (guanine527-N7)-methyltransferase